MTDETPEIPPEGTWRENVAAFEADATWLTGADKPQIKALYSIADALDRGTFQAALISQYTLVHSRLMARNPASKGGGSGGDDGDALFEATFGSKPGEMWRADQ